MIPPGLWRIRTFEFLPANRFLDLDNVLSGRLKQRVELEQSVSKTSGLRLLLPVIDPSATFHPQPQAIKTEQEQDAAQHDKGPNDHVLTLRSRQQSRKRSPKTLARC